MATRQRLNPLPSPVLDTEGTTLLEAEAAQGHPLTDSDVEAFEGSVPRRPQRLGRSDEREPQHEAPHDGTRRTRRRKATVSEDVYWLPLEEIPEGLSYEWKRWSVKGEEDPFYIASMREQGWEPVDPKKHPNWLPPGYNQPHIIKGGQILMERPMELTEEARAEQRQLSRRQVREAEQRLGTAPRDTGTRDHPGVRPQIVKEVGRMVSSQAIED